jgi:hypothetical protein
MRTTKRLRNSSPKPMPEAMRRQLLGEERRCCWPQGVRGARGLNYARLNVKLYRREQYGGLWNRWEFLVCMKAAPITDRKAERPKISACIRNLTRVLFPGISRAQTTPLSAAAPSLHRFLARIPEPQIRVPNSAHLLLIAGFPLFPFLFFGNFWLTIQNTTNRHVSNAFDLLAVFISFPLARPAVAAAVAAIFFCCCCCAPPPHPAPLFWGEGSTIIKIKSPVASALAVKHFGVGVGVLSVGVVAAC